MSASPVLRREFALGGLRIPSSVIEPDTGADIPAGSGTLGLGAESGFKRSQTPLQSQSCNVSGGSPIHICLITAFPAFEQLALSIEEDPVFLTRITTLWTSLRSLCSSNFNNFNSILPRNRSYCHSELGEWNAMNLSVCSLRFSALSIPLSEVLKPLNSNYSIVSQSYFNNFMAYLPYSRIDEVSLIVLHSFEGTPCPLTPLVCVTLKFASSLHELPLFVPDVLSQIKLLQNSPVTSQNCDSETTAVNINPYNSLILLFNPKLLSQISDNDIIVILLVQSKLGAFPAIFNVFNKSLIGSILLDWKGNSSISVKRCNNHNRITTLSFTKFSTTRDVESDRNLLELIRICLSIFPSLVDAVNEDLRM